MLEQTIKLEQLQKYADENKVQIECLVLYNVYYDQHKQIKGSYKGFMDNPPLYERLMQTRYEYIYDMIKATIEVQIEK